MAPDVLLPTNPPSSKLGHLASLAEARKSQPLSLHRGFSWTLLGSVANAGCRWAVVSAFAKLGTPELVGQYALGLALTTPVLILAMLNLRAVQVTDARQQYAFADYLGLRLIATLAALIVLAVMTALGDYSAATRWVLLAVAAAGALDALSDVYYGLFQKRGRMDLVGISMALKGVLFLIGASAGVYWTRSVAWGVSTGAAAVLAVQLFYDLPTCRALEGSTRAVMPRLSWLALSRLTWLTLPLGLNALMVSLQTNISRYFIAQSLGERELGIFAASASLVTAGRTLLAALEVPIIPRLAQHHATGQYRRFDALFAKLLVADVLIGGGMVLGVFVLGRQALTLLYTAEYARDLTVFLWLAAAGAMGYVAVTLGVGLTAARVFPVQLPLATTIMGVAALSSWWLIPSYGLHGAAWSTFITMTAQFVLYLAVYRYVLRRERRRATQEQPAPAGQPTEAAPEDKPGPTSANGPDEPRHD